MHIGRQFLGLEAEFERCLLVSEAIRSAKNAIGQRALRAAGGPNPPHPLVPFRGAPTHSKPAEASVGIARITVSKVAEQRNHPGAPIRNGGPLNYHLLATSQSRHLEYREYNIIRVSRRRSANIPLRG